VKGHQNNRRFMFRSFCTALLVMVLLRSLSASAERMPQDNWYYVKTIGTNGPASDRINNATGLALSRSNRLYVVDTGNNRIQVFDQEGNAVLRWGAAGSGNGQFNNPVAICISTNDQVYVCDRANNRIQVFDLRGEYLTRWPCAQPVGIAYSQNENLFYVADNANKRIRVFSGANDGTEVQAWGVGGDLPGQLGEIRGLVIGPTAASPVYVLDDIRFQVFTPSGEFLGHYTVQRPPAWAGGGTVVRGPCITADGMVVISENPWEAPVVPYRLLLFGQNLADFERFEIGLSFTAFAEGAEGQCYLACNLSGDCWGRGRNGVDIWQRTFRTRQASALPRPSLLGLQQRPGKTYVDVDYRIVDGDSTNVEVAAIALVNGTLSLDQVQMMKTFVENTSNHLGTNITPNRDYHLTWNAGADWVTNFSSIKICILANDGRGLLDHLFLHIPANGSHAALTISRDPVTESDLLNCWFWLVAKGDPDLKLVAGQVRSGNPVLASGTTTTAEGRAFLLGRMGVREANPGELQYVREASISGVVHQWAPRYQVGPLRWPRTVNPWGFDTGNWGPGAWWVVKL
jgi:sugar lactone lactonase YvrE